MCPLPLHTLKDDVASAVVRDTDVCAVMAVARSKRPLNELQRWQPQMVASVVCGIGHDDAWTCLLSLNVLPHSLWSCCRLSWLLIQIVHL